MRSSRPRTPQPPVRRWSRGRPSVTSLLVAGVVALACWQWTFLWLERGEVQAAQVMREWLALDLHAMRAGQVWKFFTFMFLHAHPVAVVGSALALFLAGREVEPIIGRREFLGLFVLGNLAGGLAQWAAMAGGLVPGDVVLTGVAAGVTACVVAHATLLPEWEVSPWLSPVRFRAKWLGVSAFLGAAALWVWWPHCPAGPVAMLIGAAVGWGYIKALGFGVPTSLERYFIDKRHHEARLEHMPAEQFVREEMDPVLEKIARSGMGSLTRAERRTLERGREKLGAARR